MNFCDFKLTFTARSDIGRVRSNNEDVLSISKNQGFFALADGIGGHKAGEVAAKEAVHFVSTSIETLFNSQEKHQDLFELFSFNRLCVENANNWIHHLGKNQPAFQGMGTTLCTLLFHEHFIIHSHVGDSRIYRSRNGILKQLTRDHSLKNYMIARRRMKRGRLRELAHNNILTRAIGTQHEVDVDIHIAPVTSEDVYLMCTDGLTDQVSDKEIEMVINESPDLKAASIDLIKRANKKGGRDNVTVIMVKVEYEKDHLSR